VPESGSCSAANSNRLRSANIARFAQSISQLKENIPAAPYNDEKKQGMLAGQQACRRCNRRSEKS
jgi:hypothetical protein